MQIHKFEIQNTETDLAFCYTKRQIVLTTQELILNLEAKTVDEIITGDDDEVYCDDNNEEADLSDDSLEKGGKDVASKRLSPEKEIALQTLDDVLNEAEKSMGECKIVTEVGCIAI